MLSCLGGVVGAMLGCGGKVVVVGIGVVVVVRC